MSVVIVVTAFPIPEHRAEVVAAFEEAIARVHRVRPSLTCGLAWRAS